MAKPRRLGQIHPRRRHLHRLALVRLEISPLPDDSLVCLAATFLSYTPHHFIFDLKLDYTGRVNRKRE